MNKTYEQVMCNCGCGKYYPKGQSEPCEWERIDDSIKRLTDNVVFSKGDVVERFTEQGEQYSDMIIDEIDFYKNDKFYIRASTLEKKGGINISNQETDYGSAKNPNTLRFIQLKIN